MSEDTLKNQDNPPEQLREELGALLKQHRLEKGWSWGELCGRSGLSIDLVMKIEDGHGILQPRDFAHWKKALDLDPLPDDGTAELTAKNQTRATATQELDALYEAEKATRANAFLQRQQTEGFVGLVVEGFRHRGRS
jgi:transcriptional regulator with XRE-family HTH domain